MHELSIAVGMVEMASEEAARAGSTSVSKVYLKVGALSGVVREALEFAFEVAADNTVLEGAMLVIEEVPGVVFCTQCQAERQLSTYILCCPECDTPTPDVLQGQELELTAIEVQ
jgi:hydrogenase nickel incorporation protein HypA/HybF